MASSPLGWRASPAEETVTEKCGGRVRKETERKSKSRVATTPLMRPESCGSQAGWVEMYRVATVCRGEGDGLLIAAAVEAEPAGASDLQAFAGRAGEIGLKGEVSWRRRKRHSAQRTGMWRGVRRTSKNG